MFLWDLLYRLACKGGKRVLLQSENRGGAVYLFSPDGVFTGWLHSFEDVLAYPDAWYLCDAVPPYIGRATTVLATSPSLERFKNFEKHGPERIWMGFFSRAEMSCVRTEVFGGAVSEARMEELFSRWGGVPRSVLQLANKEAAQRELERHLNRPDMADVLRAAERFTAAPGHVHCILHAQVDEECRFKGLAFASEEVSRQVALRLHAAPLEELNDLVVSALRSPDLACVRGIAFGCLAHASLCRGGRFRTRSLSAGGAEVRWLQLPALRKEALSGVEAEPLKPDTFFVLKAESDPAVDAILPLSSRATTSLGEKTGPDALLVQAAVSRNHEVQLHGLRQAVRAVRGAGSEEPWLCLAVPQDVFRHFQEQPYTTQARKRAAQQPGVKQYVLEIPITGFIIPMRAARAAG